MIGPWNWTAWTWLNCYRHSWIMVYPKNFNRRYNQIKSYLKFDHKWYYNTIYIWESDGKIHTLSYAYISNVIQQNGFYANPTPRRDNLRLLAIKSDLILLNQAALAIKKKLNYSFDSYSFIVLIFSILIV